MYIIMIVVGALLVLGVVVLLLSDADRGKVATARRLTSLNAPPPSTFAAETEAKEIRGEPWLKYIPARYRDSVNDQLGATGYKLKLLHYVMIAGGVGFVLFVVCLGVIGLSIPTAFAVMIGGAVAVPYFMLKSLQKRHTNKFLNLFPDAIDLMVRAVRAGLPVAASLDAAGKEIQDPVGNEFRLIVADMRIGLDLEEALHRAGARVRLSDFSFFVASLVLQKESGGNLAETLQILSTVLRRRAELRLKMHAMTAEARTSAYVITSLPFLSGGALAALNPTYLHGFVVNPNGAYVIGAAVAMLTMGWLTIRSMIESAMK